MSEGSVTLSPLGATVTSCRSYIDELVVGRVSEGFQRSRLKSGWGIRYGHDRRLQPNDR